MKYRDVDKNECKDKTDKAKPFIIQRILGYIFCNCCRKKKRKEDNVSIQKVDIKQLLDITNVLKSLIFIEILKNKEYLKETERLDGFTHLNSKLSEITESNSKSSALSLNSDSSLNINNTRKV